MATIKYVSRRAIVAPLILAGLLAWPSDLLARYYHGASVRQSRSIHTSTNVRVNRNVNVYGHRGVDVDVHRHGGWGVAAGVATGMVVGSMLARPPVASTPVVVGGASYYYADNAYYQPVSYGGQVQYQVVSAPPGAVIAALPTGCTVTMVGGVSYQQCGPTYYQQVPNGYRVVVLPN